MFVNFHSRFVHAHQIYRFVRGKTSFNEGDIGKIDMNYASVFVLDVNLKRNLKYFCNTITILCCILNKLEKINNSDIIIVYEIPQFKQSQLSNVQKDLQI